MGKETGGGDEEGTAGPSGAVRTTTTVEEEEAVVGSMDSETQQEAVDAPEGSRRPCRPSERGRNWGAKSSPNVA